VVDRFDKCSNAFDQLSALVDQYLTPQWEEALFLPGEFLARRGDPQTGLGLLVGGGVTALPTWEEERLLEEAEEDGEEGAGHGVPDAGPGLVWGWGALWAATLAEAAAAGGGQALPEGLARAVFRRFAAEQASAVQI
jgi:hypothetical protein